MPAAELIKLSKVGDALTLSVMSCVPLAMGQYPDVEFTGIDTERRLVALRVPKASADRQLARLDVDYGGTVGKTLAFSRDPNASQPAKPYWGINFAHAFTPPAAAPAIGKPASQVKQGIDIGPHIPGIDHEPPEDAVRPEREQMKARLNSTFKLYDACFAHAFIVATRVAKKTEGQPDLTIDVAAMAATLYIQANMSGIVF